MQGKALPDFPWDRIVALRALAGQVPGGLVDLSVGTPVDPVPDLIQGALRDHSDSPGYPTTHGSVELRESIVQWLARAIGVEVAESNVLPAIGTKELIAGLPSMLGCDDSDTIVVPEIAYPTYEVGALLAGSTVIRADSTLALGPVAPTLLWVNSPSNPTGRVLGVDHLRKVVAWARSSGCIVASDECYIELGWEGPKPVSILDPRVCDGDHTGLLAVHSLSKRSNLAGYRFGFLTGDERLVSQLLEVRKHTGFMVPLPIQAAAEAAYRDDHHVEVQRARYSHRRSLLIEALTAAGFTIEESIAGLYLWATRDEPCMATVNWLADRGILVAPGDFYGPRGRQHVRVALTATDERIELAAQRLLASN